MLSSLPPLVTDDVVVVHGNRRCIRGKDELKANFRKAFESLSLEQSVSPPEVVVRGRWAFEIASPTRVPECLAAVAS